MFTISSHTRLNLGREFARRCKNQAAHGMPCGRSAGILVCCQLVQHGQRKACGFTGTGLRPGHDIMARKYYGDRLRLNGCGFGITRIYNRAQNIGVKA